MSDDDLGKDVPEEETSAAAGEPGGAAEPVDPAGEGRVERRGMGAAQPTDAGAEEEAPVEAAPEPEPEEAAAAQPAAETPKKKSGARSVFHGVPIEVTVSVGKARPTVSDLVELRRDSVLELDASVNDPVELYIADRLIARGELQEIGEEGNRLGVRLTEVADFSNDM